MHFKVPLTLNFWKSSDSDSESSAFHPSKHIGKIAVVVGRRRGSAYVLIQIGNERLFAEYIGPGIAKIYDLVTVVGTTVGGRLKVKKTDGLI